MHIRTNMHRCVRHHRSGNWSSNHPSCGRHESPCHFTSRLTQFCHAIGIGIEAEIGHLGDATDLMHLRLTEPEDAARFVALTHVDALAVAIGNAHGHYLSRPGIDFDRLKAIRQLVNIPLVLHGGSGIPHDDLQRCIDLGISKINIFTDLAARAREQLILASQEEDPLQWITAINAGFYSVACSYIEIFRSEKRAYDLM